MAERDGVAVARGVTVPRLKRGQGLPRSITFLIETAIREREKRSVVNIEDRRRTETRSRRKREPGGGGGGVGVEEDRTKASKVEERKGKRDKSRREQ